MAKSDALREGGIFELVVKLPENIVDALRLPWEEVAGELQKELALALYQRGVRLQGYLGGRLKCFWASEESRGTLPRRTWQRILSMPEAISDSSTLIHLAGIGRLRVALERVL